MSSKHKKASGGEHKKARRNIGVPEDWHAIMRKIAAKRQQPVLYMLIALVEAEAERLDVSGLPKVPWAEGEQDDSDE